MRNPYLELTKPGIAVYVVITATVTYSVAAGGSPDWIEAGRTALGVLLATAGALALNQVIERATDSLMERTRARPIPSGRLSSRRALLFSGLLIVGGLAYLWISVGWLPAALTALSVVAYDGIYTFMKTRSYAATFAGAIPGAMPALIGWSAATGGLSLGAFVIFGVAFLWQLPHVLGLGWLLREDYARAGVLLTPPSDPEGRRIGAEMVIYSLLLLPMSLAPTLLELTGWIYFLGALVAGTLLLVASFRAFRAMTRKRARQVFFGSLLYQPAVFGLMLLDTVPG